jgi:NAD(P)-dependent dehydrogenase (short-subunit alcohol dehydrogenase family)
MTARVLVTGAASGIGAATARRFAKAGATVIVCDVNRDGGSALVDELGFPHEFIHLDVASFEAWASAIAAVQARHSQLDGLVLNAGVMLRPIGANAMDGDLSPSVLNADTYRRVMGVNCDGVVYGLLACHDLLAAASDAGVVVLDSTAGLWGFALDPIYAMSKHALTGLVQSWAPALERDGIRLTAVCPGGIETQMCPPDLAEEIASRRGFAGPEYAAAAIERAVRAGRPGEFWMARSADKGTWRYDLPEPPVGPPSGVDFVPLE